MGLQFYLPSGDEATWARRSLVGQYEPEMLTALGELARQDGTLYDIGAHTGFYTCAWLHLGGTHVEAFEPATYSREILLATVQRNGMADRVQIHALALGDKHGEGTLIVSNADVGAASAAYIASLGKADLPPSASQVRLPMVSETSVPIRRLDDLRASLGLPMPSVLKLDVEGAEAAVLAGSSNTLEEADPAILCEVHNVEAGLQIAHRLGKLQYDLRILGKNGPHTACLWTRS